MKRMVISMMAISSLILAMSPSRAQAVPSAAVELGVTGHALVPGAYSRLSLERQIELLRALGLKTYRINVNPSHTNKFARLSRLLDLAQQNGVRILPVVILPPKQYSDEASAYHDARQEVAAMARQFDGRIGIWEIGNEYDLYCVKKHTDGASTADYNTARFKVIRGLIQGMLAGLHDGSPASRSIVETTQRTPTTLDSGFLQRLTEDGVAFDIVGYHFYSRTGRLPAASNGQNSLQALHAAFHKAIWITEFDQAASGPDSGPNADPASQALALTRALHEITADAPRYEVIGADIYELLDQPEILKEPRVKPAQAQFGIFDSRGDYTAAARAVETFVHAYY
jgi:hypothetical protein